MNLQIISILVLAEQTFLQNKTRAHRGFKTYLGLTGRTE